MHNSRQLFVIFAIAVCMAHAFSVSAAGDVPTKSKHRTPFIVPISPPRFGRTTSLPAKSSDGIQFARSEWRRRTDPEFEQSLIVHQANQDLATLPASTNVKLPDRPWASRIQLTQETSSIADTKKLPRHTQSKVVGITSPNTTALSERITVHNLNVAAMEDQLRQRDSWTLEEVESAFEQLTSIEENRRIWLMYFDLLEPRKQRRIGSPASLSKCEELLRQRIFETLVALEINQFAVTKLDVEVARSRLNELIEQLEPST